MRIKRIIVFLITSLATPFFVSAQITIASRIQGHSTSMAPAYDSLTNNVDNDNIQALCGQSIFFIPSTLKSASIIGYSGFYTDHTNPKSTYAAKSEYSNTSQYEAIAGKYFDVLRVIDLRNEKGGVKTISIERIFLELRERESENIVYYAYEYNRHNPMQRFMIVGYFEKMRNNNVGRTFVSRGRIWKLRKTDITDISTGEIVDVNAEELWTCVDVTLCLENSHLDPLSLVIENEQGNRVLLDSRHADSNHYFFAHDKAAEIKNQYGDDVYGMILRGVVEIDMSEDQAILSWGYPLKRNKTIADGRLHEQWVYSHGQYLYFTNGKLTAMQN